jgi:amino acid transporter
MSVTTRPPVEPLPVEAPGELPPDGVAYRVKTRLLGPPLHTEQLEHERLGKPTALAVFASDNLSSSAYATEEILRVLVPAIGLAAFSLVVPITVAMLVVLGFLILSYRQTIKAYPTAGGAYMVTRDNFGVLPAQVAGVALLTDYVLTVSVSVAAGTAALASAIPALTPYIVPISVSFVVLIAFGNLRGVRESGRVFAVPTYFFIINMFVLLAWGGIELTSGSLPTASTHAPGLLHFGSAGDGVFLGATLFVVMHAFASGGAAVTGVEAISNGVPAFRKPEWRNARTTLVIMGSLLGVMFLGLSVLASHMHVAPYADGTPTVISQIGDLIYGGGALGRILYFSLQAGTMLILVLAANTSFADFPRLASFHAGDNFMPRQLTKRGHRLVFSNGIIFLAVAAILLLLVTGAQVDKLIPLYALGVFTSFTLSQAGMAKHHMTHKEPGWKFGLFVNATGAAMSLVVDVIIAITKFTHGAWLVVVFVPIMVIFLVRLARQYEREDRHLDVDVPAAVHAKIMRRLVVLVLVDRLDLASARAIQFGRSLHPDELRAVHFVLDQRRAEELSRMWREHGLGNLPLDLVDCPDRRLNRAAMTAVAQSLADGRSEVCVVIAERRYGGLWRRLLHDQTADSLSRDISRIPHANVTTVPFHLDDPSTTPVSGNGARPGAGKGARARSGRGDVAAVAPTGGATAPPRDRTTTAPRAPVTVPPGCTPIGDVRWRQRVHLTGRVNALRVHPIAGVGALECTLVDATGGITLVFLGRNQVPGVEIGARMSVEGIATDHHGRLAIVNPVYRFEPNGHA